MAHDYPTYPVWVSEDEDSDEDYITVAPTKHPHKFCVLLMKYVVTRDEYICTKVSQALSRTAAEALAQSWSKAMTREIR